MNNLNWEHFFQGKNAYEIWDILKSLINKLTKFIPMKKITNNKEVKPKWINGEIKKIIRETKIAYQIQKTNSSEEIQQRYRQLLQSKKGEIRKRKSLWEIKLANSIKDNKIFLLKYLSNNKKQKSSIGSLHEWGRGKYNKNIRNLPATEGHWVHQGCWMPNLKSKI